jgi:hypothetical protein
VSIDDIDNDVVGKNKPLVVVIVGSKKTANLAINIFMLAMFALSRHASAYCIQVLVNNTEDLALGKAADPEKWKSG